MITINRLIKDLQKLKADVGPRAQVYFEVDSLRRVDHEQSHAPVSGVDTECINLVDGDGFIIKNTDGSERVKTVVAIRGLAKKQSTDL